MTTTYSELIMNVTYLNDLADAMVGVDEARLTGDDKAIAADALRIVARLGSLDVLERIDELRQAVDGAISGTEPVEAIRRAEARVAS